MHFDIVIIGAGPAGCAAAITCSKAGLQTLITTSKSEQEVSLQQIQPSESIHPGVESLLAKINASYAVELAATGIYEGVQTGHQFSPLGSSLDGNPWFGTHINRTVFDDALLQTAIQHGASIIYNATVADFIYEDNCIIGIKTFFGKAITCKYVIDASGYKRIAGKKLHFKEQFFSPPLLAWSGVTEIQYPDDSTFKNKFTKFIPTPTGWTWLAPEPPHHCTWTQLTTKGKQALNPPDELQSFPLIGKVKTANCRWRIFRPLCREGIILCGDAAAILDPAAGQGILTALLSGMEAAKTIISCMMNPNEEPAYLNNYDNWFLKLYTDKAEKLKNYYVENNIRIF